jgi:hypothetical protein
MKLEGQKEREKTRHKSKVEKKQKWKKIVRRTK